MPKDYHFYTDEQLDEGKKKFDALKYPKLTAEDQEGMQDMFANFWYFDLSLEDSEYRFNNPLASAYDYHQYFAVMRKLSGYSIGVLLPGYADDEFLRKHNYHIVSDVGKYPLLRTALGEHFGLGDKLNPADCPLIYQIGLYNSDGCQEPEGKDKKAPRVFFRLTNRGSFSVFLLDLYHKLCPAPDRSSK